MTLQHIDQPVHYTQGQIEAYVYIKDSMSREAYLGWLEGSMKKYFHRFKHKHSPIDDLLKGRWFLNKLIEEMQHEKQANSTS